MRIIINAIIFCLVILSPIFSRAEENNTQEPYKILFIGSSYFNYNSLPLLFLNLSKDAGKDVYIDQQIWNGLTLEDHAKSSDTEAKIKEKKWDYVILQGIGQLMAYPEIFTDHPVYPALVKLRDKIYMNNNSTKIVFCLPWAYEDGIQSSGGLNDSYDEMQMKIYGNTIRYSNEIGFMIAPVGWAWRSVLIEKNYPLHYLHMDDWNHPSYRGSYLMALVIYSTIFQESTINIPTQAALSEEEFVLFNTTSSEIVLNNLNLWNITPIQLGISPRPDKEKISLQQNYPNPCTASTMITFELAKSSLIEIIVYDLFGKEITTLVNEIKQPGSHTVEFDGRNLPNGTYVYRMKTSDYVDAKKMILLK